MSIIENLKFKKKLFGGYDKISVMKQIEKLNEEYQKLVDKERVKYETLLEEKNKEIEQLKSDNIL